jgi:hypothetical protein
LNVLTGLLTCDPHGARGIGLVLFVYGCDLVAWDGNDTGLVERALGVSRVEDQAPKGNGTRGWEVRVRSEHVMWVSQQT